MNIRFATLDDLSSIVEIFNQAIESGNSNAFTSKVSVEERKNWFLNHKNQYFIIVSELENKIVAWSSVSPYRAERLALAKTAELSYYVHSDYQGKGIGKKIVTEAINIAKQNNIKNLFGIMLDTNEASKNLLLKLGFEIWGHLPNIVEFPNRICGQYYIGKNLSI